MNRNYSWSFLILWFGILMFSYFQPEEIELLFKLQEKISKNNVFVNSYFEKAPYHFESPCSPGLSDTIPLITPGTNLDELQCDLDHATYRWYLNGSLLPNDTTRVIIGRQSGNYEVEAVRASCVSQKSAVYAFVSSKVYQRIGGNHIWYFGQNAGLDFRYSPPKSLLDGALNTLEGCASISDLNGNLLFYTDGLSVWNKNHSKMPNGTGLKGNPSATQSSVVVPHPGNTDQYYIFTVPANEDPNFLTDGLFYSVVDMTADSGLGDVILKNDSLCSPITEKVTSVVHQNDKDIWVITHLWNSDAFYAYLVNELGIQTTPVISHTGSTHTDLKTNAAGYLKASVDGHKLALARLLVTSATPPGQFPSRVEIFDFDDQTGQVSNPITVGTYFRVYGLEFSPDSKKLYFENNQPTLSTSPFEIYQIDLDASDVVGSTTLVATHPKAGATSFMGALQLGRDGRIYVSVNGSDSLGIIQEPNQLGTASNYKTNGIYLGGRKATYGLPNFIYSAQSLGDALAANYIRLKALTYPTKIQLSWQISDPQDIGRFQVEKSSDTRNFKEIARIDAFSGQAVYTFDDREIQATNAPLYYRIKGFNSLGAFLCSPMAVVYGDRQDALEIRLSPNPLSGNQPLNIQLDGKVKDKIHLNLWDSRGQLIFRKDIQPENIPQGNYPLKLPELPKGIYLVQIRVLQSGQILNTKVVVE